MINEVRCEDFVFEYVDFIEEKNECFVFETGVVLDLCKHLQRLHQFVLLSLKNTATQNIFSLTAEILSHLVVWQNVSVKLVYGSQEDDAGYLVLTSKFYHFSNLYTGLE